MSRVLILTLAVALFLPPAEAQRRANSHSTEASESDPQFRQRRNDDEFVLRAEREAAKRRNKERQQVLKRDTDKLLQLATELKAYVDQTNENIVSLNVLKKAEEIEKLAKSVREKAKGE